ncbi:PadR family transcriptional regulator [Williamsia deligens]|uniref:PadR family transcriptional regulator n=1 Tax=Williamsia deligens TaxID=321325 RepID=A0ABW3GAA7_9NOCA|nr:PadR family transcriptional regulator [Williamsia deligens]MCP2196246.1 DNA-binding transcriptional regulator, PadR family [Williamsia deligens]
MAARRCDGTGLTPLSVLVLCALDERAMHPYELLQVLVSRKEDRFANIRPGTLYHAVSRLEERGLVRVDDVERAGNRPERTVYAVTPEGSTAVREHLAGLLATPSVEFSDIYLALAQAHELPREQVVDLIDTRLEHMAADRERWSVAHTQALARGVPEMFLLDLGCRSATLRAQIDHLRALRDRLADGSLEWKRPRVPVGPQPDIGPLTDDDFACIDPATAAAGSTPPAFADHSTQEFSR